MCRYLVLITDILFLISVTHAFYVFNRTIIEDAKNTYQPEEF
jgi:hypothetical protein